MGVQRRRLSNEWATHSWPYSRPVRDNLKHVMQNSPTPTPATDNQAEYPEPSIRLARPDVGQEEADAIARVLSTSVLTNGPETKAFEQEFAVHHDVQHGVAFASGTVALAAMFLALGLGLRDEVVVPSLTFVSSATSILHAGATPVFAEVDAETFNLDPEDVAQRITPQTRAILAVHYRGQPADLTELQAVADDAGIILLEDAAQAHGVRYKGRHVGSWGRAAMFSFTPTKNITTGEGGLVTTRDRALADRLRLLRNHGQTSLYRHEVLGYNWRLTEMQAAMGRCQLRKLEAILDRKRTLARRMGELLSPLDGVVPPVQRADRDHGYMLYTVKVDGDRDLLLDSLRRRGIESRVYFPPAHRQPIFGPATPYLPRTEDLAKRILSLPLHSRLQPAELETIGAAVHRAVKGDTPPKRRA